MCVLHFFECDADYDDDESRIKFIPSCVQKSLCSMPIKAVKLSDSVLYKELILSNSLDPRSWRVSSAAGVEATLTDAADAARFFEDVEATQNAPMDKIFISIEQDATGQHIFVNFAEAARVLEAGGGAQLTVLPEVDVKQEEDAKLLYAREAEAAVARLEEVDLCPHGWATNYSVVPELSLGRTQKLILCDEATLCRNLPEERIFEYLTLVVNCHQTSVGPGKYQVGACRTDKKPAVICQAVHEWFRMDSEMNKKNDEIQVNIWKALQQGTVAVHCLAGIHRAACIVACHFLWRHYHLGHREIPSSSREIYRRLKAVRPHVSPAYEHVLRSYEDYLQGQSSGRDAGL